MVVDAEVLDDGILAIADEELGRGSFAFLVVALLGTEPEVACAVVSVVGALEIGYSKNPAQASTP